MAKNICPDCGANLDMVGRRHRCVPNKSRATLTEPGESMFDEVMEKEGKSFPEAVDSVALRMATGKTVDGSEPSATLRKAYNAYMRLYMREWRKRREKKK